MTTALPLDQRAARASRSTTWLRQFIAQHNGRCHYCNREGSFECGPGGRPWHVDHMDPIALGGSDDEDNLTLACKRCNCSKGVKPYAVFRALAKAAYWRPDEGGLSEVELDYVFTTWCNTQRSTSTSRGITEVVWRLSRDEQEVIGQDVDGDPNSISPVLTTPAEYAPARDTKDLRFAVAAHAAVPRLIAEIRLLRGQLEEARSAPDVEPAA